MRKRELRRRRSCRGGCLRNVTPGAKRSGLVWHASGRGRRLSPCQEEAAREQSAPCFLPQCACAPPILHHRKRVGSSLELHKWLDVQRVSSGGHLVAAPVGPGATGDLCVSAGAGGDAGDGSAVGLIRSLFFVFSTLRFRRKCVFGLAVTACRRPDLFGGRAQPCMDTDSSLQRARA